MKIKCPKGELLWVTYSNTKGNPVCILTSKPSRDFYYLYEVSPDGSVNKLGRAKTPPELEKRFNIEDRMKNNSG